ncbi:MAG TPA: L-aspartate oxidase [Acidimicrobiales bacterium]
MEPLDLLVLGSGVAGLSAAVRAAETHGLRVGLLTKGDLDQATTRWAQGGVAAVLGDGTDGEPGAGPDAGEPDSTDFHLADTLAAGAGLCDVDAVRVLVDEGPARVTDLIALGAIFDRDPDGALALAREGGHSHARVVHAGGAATGVEVERALVEAVRRTAAAIYEQTFAVDLVVEGGRCVGVRAFPDTVVRARHVLVATGGAGQLFAVTTNPPEATGDGIAMALRAGAAVADLEFIQFHPTALHHPARPRPLLSEALRGHGALLRNGKGERFVDELLPRDRVSRAITEVLLEEGTDHVWLDATGLERFAERFPTIARALDEVGLDPARDWLPVAPAAHYTCGGILADLDGATSLPGLWVAGEAACNGVHGANRLASNSLLDGMVFGPRVVEAVERGKDGPEPTGAMRALLDADTDAIPGQVVPLPALPTGAGRDGAGDEPAARAALQKALTDHAGVLRTAGSLAAALDAARAAAAAAPTDTVAGHELRNLATVAAALTVAATAREETRGAHARQDHPATADGLLVRFLPTPERR